MNKINITHYTSSEYKGSLPTCEIFKRVMLIAWGTIDGSEYTYAELGPCNSRPGVVPADFISMAWTAFMRAAEENDE